MYCTKCGKELREGDLKCEFCDTGNYKKQVFDTIKEKGANAARTGIQSLCQVLVGNLSYFFLNDAILLFFCTLNKPCRVFYF